MYLIGDIGNSEIKICLVNSKKKLSKKSILIQKIFLQKKLKIILNS